MPSDPLRNLVNAKQLKAEPPDGKEFAKLVQLGREKLADTRRAELSWVSRFDLAYNAAHALAFAALRRSGYRSENRFIVFQCLAHTLGMPAGDWRVLALAHKRRNAAEYGGEYEVDERLLAEVIRVTETVLAKLEEAGPPK